MFSLRFYISAYKATHTLSGTLTYSDHIMFSDFKSPTLWVPACVFTHTQPRKVMASKNSHTHATTQSDGEFKIHTHAATQSDGEFKFEFVTKVRERRISRR